MLDVGNTHAVYNNSNVDRFISLFAEQEPKNLRVSNTCYEKMGLNKTMLSVFTMIQSFQTTSAKHKSLKKLQRFLLDSNTLDR